jgi:predicted phosphodiesterase
MTYRIALLSDIHGNAVALDAALADVRREAPDLIALLGDYVLNGPRPCETVDRVRELEAQGAIVIQGNTDIAAADLDMTAAFPWLDEVPRVNVVAAEWAHDALGDDRLDWLRRLPSERRIWVDDTLVLACHASPGSQTAGLGSEVDVATIVERVGRTEARIIACGHTHVADLRDLGWKQVVNPGSCGYAFDGDAGAAWALLEIDGDEVRATLRRALYDAQPVSDELSERGLPGDVYRAATVRTGRYVR